MRKRFSEVVREMRPEIHKIAYAGRQRVPGMTSGELEAEMLFVLWKARLSYSRRLGVSFPQYWWACWMNHKRDLLKHYFRGKRDVRKEFLFDDAVALDLHNAFPVTMEEAPPDLPETCSEWPHIEHDIWRRLASGDEVGALNKRYGKPTIDTIFLAWRSNPKIREALT